MENVSKPQGSEDDKVGEATIPPTMTNSHILEYCKSILEFNDNKIAGIDSKASFLTGISSVLFTLVSGIALVHYSSLPWWTHVFGAGAVVSLLACFIFAIRVVIPATTTQVTYTEPKNDFFCRWIVGSSREEYRESVRSLSHDSTVENYLNEIYTLAEILVSKYQRVRHASFALRAAILFMFIQIVLVVIAYSTGP